MASPDMHGSSVLGVAKPAAPDIGGAALETSNVILASEGGEAPNTTVPMVIEPTTPVAGLGWGSATAATAAVPKGCAAGGIAGEVATDKDDTPTGTQTGEWAVEPVGGMRTLDRGLAVAVTGTAGPVLFAADASLAA